MEDIKGGKIKTDENQVSLSMTQGIWTNGMYIPPDLVEEYMKNLEGKPVTMGVNGPVVGHISNIKQVGGLFSIDISKSKKSKELLERINALNNSIEVKGRHDDGVDSLPYSHIRPTFIPDDVHPRDE